MPSDIGIVDTMIGFPSDMKETYRFITDQTRDRESREDFEFPAEYMFKDVPEKGLQRSEDPIGVTLREMDLYGIEQGLVGVGADDGLGARAVGRPLDRLRELRSTERHTTEQRLRVPRKVVKRGVAEDQVGGIARRRPAGNTAT